MLGRMWEGRISNAGRKRSDDSSCEVDPGGQRPSTRGKLSWNGDLQALKQVEGLLL